MQTYLHHYKKQSPILCTDGDIVYKVVCITETQCLVIRTKVDKGQVHCIHCILCDISFATVLESFEMARCMSAHTVHTSLAPINYGSLDVTTHNLILVILISSISLLLQNILTIIHVT